MMQRMEVVQKTGQELQKQRDHKEDLQRLRGFRPMEDMFTRVLFHNN